MMCAKRFVGVPSSICNGLLQKKNEEKNAFFLRKRLAIIELFEGLWSVGTRFRY